jgi:hypothetical protein
MDLPQEKNPDNIHESEKNPTVFPSHLPAGIDNLIALT